MTSDWRRASPSGSPYVPPGDSTLEPSPSHARASTAPNSAEPLLAIDAAARLLGTSVRHMRRLVADRRIPYVKVGAKVRFDPSDLLAWIDAHRRPASD
jgi:excisionase family DNA binding protein